IARIAPRNSNAIDMAVAATPRRPTPNLARIVFTLQLASNAEQKPPPLSINPHKLDQHHPLSGRRTPSSGNATDRSIRTQAAAQSATATIRSLAHGAPRNQAWIAHAGGLGN